MEFILSSRHRRLIVYRAYGRESCSEVAGLKTFKDNEQNKKKMRACHRAT